MDGNLNSSGNCPKSKCNFDFIIIGGGPCGLACAWYLAKANLKCLIIDQNGSIGGCHEPRRVHNLFSEHGPRIYSNNYVMMIEMLQDMGMDFYDYFKPYKYSLTSTSTEILNTFTFYEKFILVKLFIYSLLDRFTYAKSVSVLQFATQYNFSDETKTVLDRLCRLMDGAGSDRYTLFELFQLVNQTAFYKFYQPSAPLDVNFFPDIRKTLISTGNVIFKTNTLVQSIESQRLSIGQKPIVQSLDWYSNSFISNIKFANGTKLNISKNTKLILAIPPENIVNILKNSKKNIQNAFGNFNQLRKFDLKTRYEIYISMTFHWDHKFDIPNIWGGPTGEWGIASIVLTDYMKLKQPSSKIVMSVAIIQVDTKSNKTFKTANETNSKEELVHETFRQLQIVYQNKLPKFKSVVFNPNVFYKNGKWQSVDKAFVRTPNINPIPQTSQTIKNLFNCGTHSLKHKFHITTYESAVSNAIHLCHTLNINAPQIKSPFSIEKAIVIIIVIILIWKLRN